MKGTVVLAPQISSVTKVSELPLANGEPTLKEPINWLQSAVIIGAVIAGASPPVLVQLSEAGVIDPSTANSIVQALAPLAALLTVYGRWNGGKSLSPLKGTSYTK